MPDTPAEFPRMRPGNGHAGSETGVRLPGTQPVPSPSPSAQFGPSTGSSALAPIIEIDKLYQAAKGTGTQFITALESLAEAIDLLAQARVASQKNSPIDADRCVQRFEALLPQLFRYRKIGDGYGVIVNALHFAAVNRRGRPLNTDQITTTWLVLRELRSKPFLEFEQALDQVAELENCGIEVDPPVLSELLAALEE